MNDVEREIRDALLRHQQEAPSFEVADARRAAGLAQRRQVRNVVVGAIAGAAAVFVAIAGFGGLVRADRQPTPLDPPSVSTCVATSEPDDGEVVNGWPDTTKNRAGVYSWGALPHADDVIEGFMHNAYSPGSGEVEILVDGLPGQLVPHQGQTVPGRLVPHQGQTAATVAGCEGTYRSFIGEVMGRRVEQWMVDIQGTTVTISLHAGPGAPPSEVDEAHEIIESIRAEPRDDPYGFRLLFTLTTGTWDSG